MSDQVQQISRALEDGDFHCALTFMGLADNTSFRFSSRGPPEIPAFSPKKPRLGDIPPTRPKIYGPPPYPAFQRRNSQNTAIREQHDGLKDSGMFLNFSRSIPRSMSSEVTSYPVLDPGRFFPTILIDSATSSMFLPCSDDNMSKEDEDEPMPSEDEDTPMLSEEDLCPFCACAEEDNNDNTPATENKQLVFEVLKAVNSEQSSASSRFTDLSPKEVCSALDVRPAAILTTQQVCDVTETTPEDKHLSVMFSTDTFQDSSASSTQELCMICREEEQESTTYIDAELPTCGPMSDTVLPQNSRLMTLS